MRQKLREQRTKRKLTQKKLAEYLGITTRYYAMIESGDRGGSYQIWDKLETIFNVPQIELRQNVPRANQD